MGEPGKAVGLAAIRAAAEKQKKLQRFAADGSLKGTTVEYEMAKLSDVILLNIDVIAKEAAHEQGATAGLSKETEA